PGKDQRTQGGDRKNRDGEDDPALQVDQQPVRMGLVITPGGAALQPIAAVHVTKQPAEEKIAVDERSAVFSVHGVTPEVLSERQRSLAVVQLADQIQMASAAGAAAAPIRPAKMPLRYFSRHAEYRVHCARPMR